MKAAEICAKGSKIERRLPRTSRHDEAPKKSRALESKLSRLVAISYSVFLFLGSRSLPNIKTDIDAYDGLPIRRSQVPQLCQLIEEETRPRTTFGPIYAKAGQQQVQKQLPTFHGELLRIQGLKCRKLASIDKV